ncbi:unnamed protein product [Boreogadus saida]
MDTRVDHRHGEKSSESLTTELDLNGGSERGDKEGKVKTLTEDHRKQTASWDKTTKDRTFVLPTWYNVW